MINAAAVALGLLTQSGPPPHIAELVGEEICTVARRTVEVCQRTMTGEAEAKVLHVRLLKRPVTERMASTSGNVTTYSVGWART